MKMPEDSPKPNVNAISRIAVAGFKSIDAEQHIDIAPLTLLAGANSAGKSSIMQPLLLWKQTLEAPFDPGPLLLNGPCVRFTSVQQFFFRDRQRYSAAIESTAGLMVQPTYARFADGAFGIEAMAFRRGHTDEISKIAVDSDSDELRKALPPGVSQAFQPGGKYANWFDLRVARAFCFLKLQLRASASAAHSLDEKLEEWLSGAQARPLFDPGALLIPLIQRIIHIPGLRGNPERSYQTTAVGDHFPGTFDPYVASLINHWQQTDEPRHAALVQDLRAVGLTRDVKAERLDDTQVQLRVARLPAGGTARDTDLVNIADVGFGVSQAMPVITALHAADAGRLVYIEQPELHLHPRAQAALADVLVRAANRGVRVVAETHSSILLRAVQTAVARNQIVPSDVSLNWFARDPRTGATTVTRADLHDDGSFGDWPEDFDDVALDVEGAYLDAVEARHAT
jgi:hypothetical protein